MEDNNRAASGAPEPDLSTLVQRLGEYLERLETGTMDDAERRAVESDRRVRELSSERERLSAAAGSWEKRYKKGLLGRLISEAAVAAGAYRPDQIVTLLSQKSRWNEEGTDPILALKSADGKESLYEKDRFVEGVKAYLADNPNLAGGGAGGGAGSKPSTTPASSGSPTTLGELRRMRSQLEDQARLMR
jgi:hypothetical protein